ncbi:MAG: ABC transporter permease [Treponema sp.]|nr:ABC transporter permease [Treponema sp.]
MSGWVGFAAARLTANKRGAPPPALSILSIAAGVLALMVIIAVMNGFQLGFIESILEISSYYVRVDSPPSGEEGRALLEKIRALPGVKAVVPFREIQALIRGKEGQQGAVIRGLPPEALREDPGMAEKLVFEEGSFDFAGEDSILLGAELAGRLQAGLGDTVQLVSISGGTALMAGGAEGGGFSQSSFTVRGIFRCGFYEYDLGWGFISLEKAGELAGEDYTLGIKLQDRWQDRKAAAAIAELAGKTGGEEEPRIRTWRDFNRAFFGALRTEKLFMFMLVGLIFIVVGLNIYQAQRRIVLERREEIGLLRAVGARDLSVRLIFVWDGFITGFIGAGTGMILGLLVSFNIAAFFTFLEKAVNGLLSLFNRGEGFAIFSPAVFYIKEIEGRVIPREALAIFLFGLGSALGAAWFASGKVSRIRPAEVLRYE